MDEFLARVSEFTDNIGNLCAQGMLGNSRVHLLAISAENEELKKIIRNFSEQKQNCNNCKNGKFFA